MALNFPSDTSLPYLDPNSGLKYIFNPSAGAWESAIQPPVIVASTPPTGVVIPGFLYWDKEDGNLYIYYTDENSSAWVQAVPDPEIPRTYLSTTPPVGAIAGDLWWDEDSGRLYVYYTERFLEDGVTEDPNPSSQWVDASPASVIPDKAPVTISNIPPENPLVGNLWWNKQDGNLYVWYEDIDGGMQWVVSSASIGIGSSGLLKEVTGTLPVEINTSTNGADKPIISVQTATDTSTGVVRFATQVEHNNASSTAVALTPGGLADGIKNYVPDATDVIVGSQRNATQVEVDAGLLDNVTVTPETLANSTLIGGAPVGSILCWPIATPPTGWLECNGSDISRSVYADLFAVIDDNYGIGNGTTTFNLPDLRGEFVRGWDNAKGTDGGRAIGSFQGQQIQQHFHTVPALNISVGTGGATQSVLSGIANVNTGNTGGTETRPRNIAMMFIIKT